MAFTLLNDVYYVAFAGTYASQRILLTHHYQITAITPPVDYDVAAQVLATALRGGVGGGDLIETKYLACLPTTYELDFIRVQKVKPTRLVVKDTLRGVPGTHEDEANTGNLAGTITLRTDFAGREQVSTKHIGPIPTSDGVNQNGELSAPFKVKLQTLGTALLQSYSDLVTGITFTPVILHPTDIDPPDTDVLKSGIVGSQTRVMRRRTLRFGE